MLARYWKVALACWSNIVRSLTRLHDPPRPCEAHSAEAIQTLLALALFFSGLPRTLTGARKDGGVIASCAMAGGLRSRVLVLTRTGVVECGRNGRRSDGRFAHSIMGDVLTRYFPPVLARCIAPKQSRPYWLSRCFFYCVVRDKI